MSDNSLEGFRLTIFIACTSLTISFIHKEKHFIYSTAFHCSGKENIADSFAGEEKTLNVTNYLVAKLMVEG